VRATAFALVGSHEKTTSCSPASRAIVSPDPVEPTSSSWLNRTVICA
jgi:hypothetical protein